MTRAGALTWTSEKPQVEGWYWFKFVGEQNERVETMMHVMECPFVNSLAEDAQLWCSMGFVQRLDGHWAGPIDPPGE